MSERARWQPRPARSLASARPMPDPAPVMAATRPVKSFMTISPSVALVVILPGARARQPRQIAGLTGSSRRPRPLAAGFTGTRRGSIPPNQPPPRPPS